MEFGHILQALLSLVFVLGLVFIVLWFIKFCQSKGCAINLGPNQKSNRIQIIERKIIDSKTSVVLMECDSSEYLLLIGNNNVLLHSSAKKVGKND